MTGDRTETTKSITAVVTQVTTTYEGSEKTYTSYNVTFVKPDGGPIFVSFTDFEGTVANKAKMLVEAIKQISDNIIKFFS